MKIQLSANLGTFFVKLKHVMIYIIMSSLNKCLHFYVCVRRTKLLDVDIFMFARVSVWSRVECVLYTSNTLILSV